MIPHVFLVKRAGTRMSFLHVFPAQPPCPDLAPHATALPCLPACPPSEQDTAPSQPENQVFAVLQAITFQTAAPRLYKCRLSISGKEAEARKGPKSYPAARPFKSFPASFSTPFLDCRVITNFSSSLAFSAAFGARSEKENPLFNSREVKRSTYFL